MEIKVSNQNFNEENLCLTLFDGKVNGRLMLDVGNGYSVEIFVDGETYDKYDAGKHDLGYNLNDKLVQIYGMKTNDITIYFGMRILDKYVLNGCYEVHIVNPSKIYNLNKQAIQEITIDDVRDTFNCKIKNIMDECDLDVNCTADDIRKFIERHIYEELIDNGMFLKSLVVGHFGKIN